MTVTQSALTLQSLTEETEISCFQEGEKPGHRDKVFLPVSFEPEFYDHLTKICPKVRWREEVWTELRESSKIRTGLER